MLRRIFLTVSILVLLAAPIAAQTILKANDQLKVNGVYEVTFQALIFNDNGGYMPAQPAVVRVEQFNQAFMRGANDKYIDVITFVPNNEVANDGNYDQKIYRGPYNLADSGAVDWSLTKHFKARFTVGSASKFSVTAQYNDASPVTGALGLNEVYVTPLERRDSGRNQHTYMAVTIVKIEHMR